MVVSEEFLKMKDGVALFLRITAPESGEVVRANVVLTHGMGEHIGRYGHVAAALARRGFRFCAYDLRGHGRSGGARGDVANDDLFLRDLRAALERFSVDGLPLFLYGHSLGGQITLRFILKNAAADSAKGIPPLPPLAGAIITSPWLRLAFEPPRWKTALAKFLLRVWPTFSQSTGMRPERLSSDQAFLAAMPDLQLVYHRMSARMFVAFSAGAETAMAQAERLSLPVLLLHGAEDRVTSPAATREFFQRCGSSDKTLRIYCGMRHETHNERRRELVISDIARWLEEHTAQVVASGEARG